MKQIFKGRQRSGSDVTVEAPCQSHPNLQLKVADWISGLHRRQLPGPERQDRRAELAAIDAALTQDYTHIATDSLSSLHHQLRKQILYPEKHRHHVQGNVLKKISNIARASQDHIFFYK
eukprot:607633-Pelagomonas_calceolata.AAC.1